MFARCPDDRIHESMTDAALVCPIAMFSPKELHRYPTAASRSGGSG
jgi:hypothetical protein